MGSGVRRALGLALALAAAGGPAGCARPPGRIGFRPEAVGSGREETFPEASAAPRSRMQHTFGAGESLFPHLSADRSMLYYASSRQGPRFAIVKRPRAGGPVTAVTSGSFTDIHPALAPDGRKLAFSSNRESGWHLYLLDEKAGSSARRLTPRDGDAFGPSWAPDSRRLAYFRSGVQSGTFEIWVLDVEVGTEGRLAEGLFPSWSPPGPDGEWIAYQRPARDPGGWYSIWKVRPDSSRPTELVVSESWGAVHPTWSPDGRWIGFAAVGKSPEARGGPAGTGARADDIYVVSAQGTHLTNLTGDRRRVREWNPSFGSDGRIYFNSDQGGGAGIWSIDPRLPAPPPPPPTAAREGGASPASGEAGSRRPALPASAPALEGGLGVPAPPATPPPSAAPVARPAIPTTGATPTAGR